MLLCHGFTGSPASLRPWADRLAAEGFSVRLPLLPGHGTSWQQMNRTTFDDWLGHVQAELTELSAQCRAVIVGGLSMGGTLALRLAELHPNAIAGLVLVNPSVMSLRREMTVLPVLKHLVPSLKGITDDIARPGATELRIRTGPRSRRSTRCARDGPPTKADLGADDVAGATAALPGRSRRRVGELRRSSSSRSRRPT